MSNPQKNRTEQLMVCGENIDLSLYKAEIDRIKTSLANIIALPEDISPIVSVLYQGGRIVLISIDTSTPGTNDHANRIVLRKHGETVACGTLDCKALIKFSSKENRAAHVSFNFHFNPIGKETDLKSFRLDYAPGGLTPLHAHDAEYEITNHDHLTYPEDIDLNLTIIDFCTVMYLIAYYIKNPQLYPLDNGTLYNEKIITTRRKYENNREDRLF